jgi:hypothetical protein
MARIAKKGLARKPNRTPSRKGNLDINRTHVRTLGTQRMGNGFVRVHLSFVTQNQDPSSSRALDYLWKVKSSLRAMGKT